MMAKSWVHILKLNRVFLLYCTVLLIVAGVFYTLPAYPGLHVQPKTLTLTQLAYAGHLEEADWPVVKNRWDFSSPGAGLFLTTANEYLDTAIFVAETAPEGRILVTEYAASSFMAERLSDPLVSLSATELKINRPMSRIELYYFERDILPQFAAEQSSFTDGWFFSNLSPEVIIYIQIPQGMKVEAKEELQLIFLPDQ